MSENRSFTQETQIGQFDVKRFLGQLVSVGAGTFVGGMTYFTILRPDIGAGIAHDIQETASLVGAYSFLKLIELAYWLIPS